MQAETSANVTMHGSRTGFNRFQAVSDNGLSERWSAIVSLLGDHVLVVKSL